MSEIEISKDEKQKILEHAVKSGCDPDADIVSYNGNGYFVYLHTNTVELV